MNGTDSDALVTLAGGGITVRAVYVRAHDTAAVERIPDGTFEMFVTYGRGWDARREAIVAARSVRYARPTTFFSSPTRTTQVRLTLHRVPGGNTTTRPVPTDAVPGPGR